MEIEITPVERFAVKVDGVLVGIFEKEAEWEGFLKLKNGKGVVIAHKDMKLIDSVFENLFNPNEKNSYSAVKITPDLIPIKDS